MKITTREIECEPHPVLKLWCECRTPEDIDDMIAWLTFARRFMIDTIKWNAKTAQKKKAPTSQNEAGRQVSGSAQNEKRQDGQRPIEAIEE